jgi:hypothetical protein
MVFYFYKLGILDKHHHILPRERSPQLHELAVGPRQLSIMRLSRAVVPRMRAAFSSRDGAALSDLFNEAVPREEGRLLLVVTAQMAANVRQGTILHLSLVILSGQEFNV